MDSHCLVEDVWIRPEVPTSLSSPKAMLSQSRQEFLSSPVDKPVFLHGNATAVEFGQQLGGRNHPGSLQLVFSANKREFRID